MLCISEPTVHVDKQPPRLVAAEWRNGRQDESMSANKTRQLAGFVTQKTFILYMVYIMILCGENAFGPTHSLQYHKYVCVHLKCRTMLLFICSAHYWTILLHTFQSHGHSVSSSSGFQWQLRYNHQINWRPSNWLSLLFLYPVYLLLMGRLFWRFNLGPISSNCSFYPKLKFYLLRTPCYTTRSSVGSSSLWLGLLKRIHLKARPPGLGVEGWHQGSTNAMFGSKMGFQTWHLTLLSHFEQL